MSAYVSINDPPAQGCLLLLSILYMAAWDGVAAAALAAAGAEGSAAVAPVASEDGAAVAEAAAGSAAVS